MSAAGDLDFWCEAGMSASASEDWLNTAVIFAPGIVGRLSVAGVSVPGIEDLLCAAESSDNGLSDSGVFCSSALCSSDSSDSPVFDEA